MLLRGARARFLIDRQRPAGTDFRGLYGRAFDGERVGSCSVVLNLSTMTR